MNCYFSEVLEAHELICSWLNTKDLSCDKYEALFSRFSEDYSMITPNGDILDLGLLKDFFKKNNGVRSELKIEIMDMKLLSESSTGATMTYKEKQTSLGQQVNFRFATVVFEKDSNQKVIWKHLHETFTG